MYRSGTEVIELYLIQLLSQVPVLQYCPDVTNFSLLVLVKLPKHYFLAGLCKDVLAPYGFQSEPWLPIWPGLPIWPEPR